MGQTEALAYTQSGRYDTEYDSCSTLWQWATKLLNEQLVEFSVSLGLLHRPPVVLPSWYSWSPTSQPPAEAMESRSACGHSVPCRMSRGPDPSVCTDAAGSMWTFGSQFASGLPGLSWQMSLTAELQWVRKQTCSVLSDTSHPSETISSLTLGAQLVNKQLLN